MVVVVVNVLLIPIVSVVRDCAMQLVLVNVIVVVRLLVPTIVREMFCVSVAVTVKKVVVV